MSILSTNHRLISIGESYSAGNGIDITDQIISVTGNVVPYSAGDNIDIQDHVISGKDWSQDITDASSNAFNETTAWVTENYVDSADVSYLSGVVDNKLDTSAWSSVSSNFATEDYVIMADNITYDRATGYVDSQQFAKESACQSAFEQLNTNKLDTSSFSEASANFYTNDNPSGFITGVDLSNYYTKDETSGKEELANAFANIPVGDPEVNAYVTDNSASINGTKSLVQSNSSTWNDITAYQSNSATLNEVSTTVQTNSAQWADGGSGDEEVNSFVYNNSATINEVNTTYQTYSASYQPSGNYIPYTGYSASLGYVTNSPFTIHEGSFTNSLGRANIFIENRITSNIYNNMVAGPTYVRFSTPSDSAQVDLPSIKNWNDVSTTVQSNSAQWAEGGGSNPEVESYVINNSATIDEVNTTYQQYSASYLTAHQSLANYYTTAEANTLSSMLSGAIDYVSANAGGNVPVSNSGDLYKVEFDGVDLYGYKSTSSSPNYVYSAVSSQESNYIQHTPYPQWNNEAIQDLRNWSAFDIISISSNGNGIRPVGYPGGITALDVYYQAKYVFDYNENQLPDFSGYVGQITLDNLFISSYFDKPSYYDNVARCSQFRLWFSGNDNEGMLTNNHYICSVGTEVQSGTNTISGIFVPSAIDTNNYIPYTTSGLELPNSHFKIDASGQAYKLAIVNSAEQPLNDSFFQADNTLSYPFSKGRHYIVNVPSSRKTFDVRSVSPYAIICSGVVQNGVCDFVYPSSGVTGYKRFYTYNDYGTAPLTTANCKLYYFKTSPSGEYVLKSDLPTYEYDSSNKISAINGSALAGGGEVPTGTMNVSGLEYNAVNEISAYNGSAIAQYGAEKQWLVHDDTLVHISNSAQYALGCNVSALQRLMGIDETVLFFAGNESSGVQSGNLTESIKNFKRIRVAGMDNDGHTDVKYIYPAWTKNADGFSTSGYEVMLYGANPYAPQSTIWEKWTRYSFSALTSFNVVLSYEGSYTANSVNNVTNNHKNSIREVVGIGRISG